MRIRTTSSVSSCRPASSSLNSSSRRFDEPSRERPQPAAAGAGERARLVGELQQVGRRLLAAGQRQRHLDQAASERSPAPTSSLEAEAAAFASQRARAGAGRRRPAPACSSSGWRRSRRPPAAVHVKMSSSEHPHAIERSAATRLMRSFGSSIACRQEIRSRTSCRSKRQRPALHAEGDVELFERARCRPRCPVRDGHEDRDVAELARARVAPVRAVAHRPALVSTARSIIAREQSPLLRADLRGAFRVAVAGAMHDDDARLRRRRAHRGGLRAARWRAARPPPRRARGRRRCWPSRGCSVDRAEVLRDLPDAVRERATPQLRRRRRCRLGGSGRSTASGRRRRTGRPAAARSVAPVLARPSFAREAHHDLGLDRVGVLELVDEDPREAVVEVVAHLGVVAQQVARPHQQVVEVGGARRRGARCSKRATNCSTSGSTPAIASARSSPCAASRSSRYSPISVLEVARSPAGRPSLSALPAPLLEPGRPEEQHRAQHDGVVAARGGQLRSRSRGCCDRSGTRRSSSSLQRSVSASISAASRSSHAASSPTARRRRRRHRCERQHVAVLVELLGDLAQVLGLHPAVQRRR